MKLLQDSLQSVYREIASALSRHGIVNVDYEARLILNHRTGFDWGDIIAKPDTILDKQKIEAIENDLALRVVGTPLSRIHGKREFWGLPFSLSDETLDPRPDSETLIFLALQKFQNKPPHSILDLGTGSGCLLIAFLHEFRNARGFGIDRSYNALQTARENARQNQVVDRAQFCCGDWAQGIAAKFDLIVSNPPYIAQNVIPTLSPEVRNHDPILALDGGEDGLKAYRTIFSGLKSYLEQDGIALFEIGYDQGESVPRLAVDAGLNVVGVHLDLAGLARVVEISRGDK